MTDYISRQEAIEYFMTNTNWHDEDGYPIEDADEKRKLLKDYFSGVPSADVREPKLLDDGTLSVKVDDAIKVGRVLVQDDNTGGLYYPDEERQEANDE